MIILQLKQKLDYLIMIIKNKYRIPKRPSLSTRAV
jgi:hypothetical protein